MLAIHGDIANNFANFKEEVTIYLTYTETVKKFREIQVARLKNLLGPDGLKLYNTLSGEKDIETVTSIIEVLEKYCKPKQNMTMDIYKLLTRKQSPNEPFDSFYADLRRLIKPCNLNDQEDKIMKALIALGVNSRELQQKLFCEDANLEMQNIHNKEWEKGRIIEKLPQPRSFLVRNNNGGVQRRNTIHIRKINRVI